MKPEPHAPAQNVLSWKLSQRLLVGDRLDDRKDLKLEGLSSSLQALLGFLMDHCSPNNALPDRRLVCWPSISKERYGIAACLRLSRRHVGTLVKGLADLGAIEARRGPEAGTQAQHDGSITFADGRTVRVGKGYLFIMAIPFASESQSPAVAASQGRVPATASRVPPLPQPQRGEFTALVGPDGVSAYLEWLQREWSHRAPDETTAFRYHNARFEEWQTLRRLAASRAEDVAAERKAREYIARRAAKIAKFPQSAMPKRDGSTPA